MNPSKQQQKQQPSDRLDTVHITKLVQQIQRKFANQTTAKTNDKDDDNVIQGDRRRRIPHRIHRHCSRPCDAAAIAIGKELGNEFLHLLQQQVNNDDNLMDDTNAAIPTTATSSTSSNNDNNTKAWSVVRDSILNIFCMEYLNPAISQSFFDILIQYIMSIGMTRTTNHNDIDDYESNNNKKNWIHFKFLSEWMIHIEQISITTSTNTTTTPGINQSSSIANTLSGCIRAYSMYSIVLCSIESFGVSSSINQSTNRDDDDSDDDETMGKSNNRRRRLLRVRFRNDAIQPNAIVSSSSIIQSWLNLQSTSSRLALTHQVINGTLIELVKIMASSNDNPNNNNMILMLQSSAYLLSPLMAVTIIDRRIMCCGDKQRILSYIHRIIWSQWKQYQEYNYEDDEPLGPFSNRNMYDNNNDTNLYRTRRCDETIDIVVDCFQWIRWMTSVLDMFLYSLDDTAVSRCSDDREEASRALYLAEGLLSEIMELSWFPIQQMIGASAAALESRKRVNNRGADVHNDNENSIRNVDERIIKVQEMISSWISQQILRIHVPKIVTASIYSVNATGTSSRQLLETMTDLFRTIDDEYTMLYNTDGGFISPCIILLDAVSALRLCTLIMVTPSSGDRLSLLEILSLCIKYCDSDTLPITAAMVRAISVQFLHDEFCHMAANALQMALDDRINEQATTIRYNSSKNSSNEEDLALPRRRVSLIDLVVDWKYHNEEISSLHDESMTGYIATIPSFSDTNFSALQQAAALLYGISLLECAADDHAEEVAYKFLHTLLQQYPHLGVSLLTVISVRLNQASYECDGMALLRNLEFICTSLVADSQSAQEVWNLVGIQWMDPNYSPLSVRVALIRLFPKLIEGNKRLYRRVIDTLAGCLAGKELGIRLAAATTIADLAANDCIRDVIGHIQGLLTKKDESTMTLTPIHSLLVHFALRSLHYLVVADELDYDVVIQVLKKKLCSVTDFSAILKLPLVVLESFVLLLGDGECGTSDDDEDDDNDDDEQQKPPKEKVISSHVEASVQALIHIIKFVGEDEADPESSKKNPSHGIMVERVKWNAYQSLSRYSLQALGITENGLTGSVVTANDEDKDDGSGTDDASQRYLEIRDLIVDGLESLPTNEDVTASEYLLALAGKIVEFEEENLGASLWQKRGKSRSSNIVKSGKAKSKRVGGRGKMIHQCLTFLPLPSDVIALVADKSSPSSAVVQLLTSDGTNLDVLRDCADTSIESSDSFMLVFALQGYLQAASNLVSSKAHSIHSIIAEISSWSANFISSDATHLALCCLSVYIPHDQQDGENPTTFVEDIYQRTIDAYQNHGFHKGDIAKICLGLLGASALRYAEIDRLYTILDMLEHSVVGYGGQHSFGAFYAIAIIAQSATKFVNDTQSRIDPIDIIRLVSRTTSFVIESLLACFDVPSSHIVTGLVACLKSGMATPDLVDIVSTLESDSIPTLVNKEAMARDIFMCCSLCLPSLVVVSGDLLVAVTYLLDSFEWGTGKGFALQSVLAACTSKGVMSTEKIHETFISGYVTLFEGRTDTSEKEIDSHGLDEIFYTINGPYLKPPPPEVRQIILQNKLIWNDSACQTCLVAFINSTSSIFCLGTTDIWTLGQMDSTISGPDVTDIIGKVVEMAGTKSGDVKNPAVGGFGTIIMAFLSSLNDIQPIKTDVPVIQPTTDQPENKVASTLEINFSTLPRSNNGTVVATIIDVLERLLDGRAGNDVDETKLACAIGILNRISVPGQYAYSFVEPLLKENMARKACLLFLCSQVSGRRRVYVEGVDFLGLVTTICAKSPYDIFEEIEPGSVFDVFVQNLHDIIPKIHLEYLNNVLTNVWTRCTSVSGSWTRRRTMANQFLKAMKKVLASEVPSFKVMSVVRMFVLSTVFSDLVNQDIDEIMTQSTVASQSTLDLFSLCLIAIPLALVEECSIFKNRHQGQTADGLSGDAFRIAILLELIKAGYFDALKRGGQELSNVTTWLSRQLLLPSSSSDDAQHDDTHVYQRVACSFASATVLNQQYSVSRRDILTSIFDILLLTKDSMKKRLGIKWLGVVLAYWNDGNGSDSDISLGYLCSINFDSTRSLPSKALDQFISIMIDDLPYNLCTVCREEKMVSIVANYLQRIYDSWYTSIVGTNDDENEMIVHCIRRAIILFEQGSNKTNQDTFVDVASTILTQVVQ